MLRLIVCLICCLTQYQLVVAQSPFGKYFELKVEQIPLSDRTLLNIYPALKPSNGDSVMAFMNRHKRRFEYILLNRTSFSSRANDLYPDVKAMSTRYTDSLIYNPRFIGYYNRLVSPAALKGNSTMLSVLNEGSGFSKKEMMEVASRFFYCDGIRPNGEVTWHVCIGLNGVKEANWTKDMTLLEAFVFEAIFNTWMTGSPADQQLLERFTGYVSAAGKNYQKSGASLEAIRSEVFLRMQEDSLLAGLLNRYYDDVRHTLPFVIL